MGPGGFRRIHSATSPLPPVAASIALAPLRGHCLRRRIGLHFTPTTSPCRSFPSPAWSFRWGTWRAVGDSMEPATVPPSGVSVRDPYLLEKKKAAIRSGGLSKLQVIADFDGTLTRYWIDGRRGQTSHGLLQQGNAEYDAKRQALYEYYHPLEISPIIPIEEKTKLMKEWVNATSLGYKRITKDYLHIVYSEASDKKTLFTLLALFGSKYPGIFFHNYTCLISVDNEEYFFTTMWEKTHGLLIEGGLTYDAIKRSVSEATIAFRDGVVELFEFLEERGVPVLVFSAGLADIIEEVFRQKLHRSFKNIKIVSNKMVFDENGHLVAFKGKTIHVLNKNEHALDMAAPVHNNFGDPNGFEPDSALVKKHTNVLLLGDHIGDLGMSDGLNYENRIAVGFLNNYTETSQKSFLDAFDIVYQNDASMGGVVELVSQLCADNP